MISKLRKIPSIIEAGRIFYNSHFLNNNGWWQSYRSKLPVDKDGSPLPWVTYSFIDFISPRLTRDLMLFEFGSGNSSLFYSSKVGHVTALEHEKQWYQHIKNKVPSNVTLLLEELEYDGKYCRMAMTQPSSFDIIIVDGRDRVNCVYNSVEKLTDRGVIVLDDSERPQYQPATEFLTKSGFKSIDFWGLAPGLTYNKSTTLFYKPSNCLNV